MKRFDLTRMHARCDLLCSILWILMACVMIACLVIGIMGGNPILICVAMFATSIDGINAYRYFRQWLTWHRLMKSIERGEWDRS